MKLTCHRCGHSWNYQGERRKTNCSRCATGVTINPRRRVRGGWHHTEETRQRLSELRLGRGVLLKDDARLLSYVAGVVTGDGSIRRSEVRLNTVSLNFAKAFHEALAKLGLKPRLYQFPSQRTRKGNQVFTVMVHSPLLANFLNSPKREEYACRYPVEYIRGFYESEGSLADRCVIMAVREKNLFKLRFVKNLLRELGFRTSIYKIRVTDRDKYGHIFQLRLLGGQETAQFFMRLIQPSIKGFDDGRQIFG